MKNVQVSGGLAGSTIKGTLLVNTDVAPERPPMSLCVNPSVKDMPCVYAKIMKDKKRLKTKSIILLVLFSSVFYSFSNGFYQIILGKRNKTWKNIHGTNT